MSHYVFSFICNVWMLYKREREREKKKEKKKRRDVGRGVNCEEKMREKNEMGEGGCMCMVGEKRKERRWVHGWWGKKEMGSGVYEEEWKRKKKKNFERENTKLVLFVCSLCLV